MNYMGIVKNALTNKQVNVAYVGPDPVAAKAAADATVAYLTMMGQNVNSVVLSCQVWVP